VHAQKPEENIIFRCHVKIWRDVQGTCSFRDSKQWSKRDVWNSPRLQWVVKPFYQTSAKFQIPGTTFGRAPVQKTEIYTQRIVDIATTDNSKNIK
jgi:hypothetical protein